MDQENNIIRRSCVAGIYAAGSDAVVKHLRASNTFLGPYLVHNLNPFTAGIAGCLISFTAEKCHLYFLKWLPESYQNSTTVLISTRVFSHILVGGAFGTASALFLPSAGITAVAGVALGLSSFVGMTLDKIVELIVITDYHAKARNSYDPFLNEIFPLHSALSTSIMPFSDAIAKYFVSPQSFLGHLLIHNVQSILGNLSLGLFISLAAHWIYVFGYEVMKCEHHPGIVNDLFYFAMWASCHLLAGGAIGLTLSLFSSIGFTTGIAMGTASFVGPTLIRLASKVLRTFYTNVMLQTAIHQNPGTNQEFRKILFADINKKGSRSHQIAFFMKYLKMDCLSDFLEMITEDANIKKMNQEEFGKWKLTPKNVSFLKGAVNQNHSAVFNSEKASLENFTALYYMLTETLIILNACEYSLESRFSRYETPHLWDYEEIYPYLSEKLKNNPNFHVQAICKLGYNHWRVMKNFKNYQVIEEVFCKWKLQPGLQVKAQPNTKEYKKELLEIAIKNEFLENFYKIYLGNAIKATTDYIKKYKIIMDPSLEKDRKKNPESGLYPAFTALENEDENTVRENALKDNSILHYSSQTTIKNLLPELIEDKKFIGQIERLYLFKAAAKANNVKEGDLIKNAMIFLLCLKRLNPKIPKPLHKKIIAYSIL